jgi:hypothetical protein
MLVDTLFSLEGVLLEHEQLVEVIVRPPNRAFSINKPKHIYQGRSPVGPPYLGSAADAHPELPRQAWIDGCKVEEGVMLLLNDWNWPHPHRMRKKTSTEPWLSFIRWPLGLDGCLMGLWLVCCIGSIDHRSWTHCSTGQRTLCLRFPVTRNYATLCLPPPATPNLYRHSWVRYCRRLRISSLLRHGSIGHFGTTARRSAVAAQQGIQRSGTFSVFPISIVVCLIFRLWLNLILLILKHRELYSTLFIYLLLKSL